MNHFEKESVVVDGDVLTKVEFQRFEHVPVPACLVDADGMVLQHNRRAAELLNGTAALTVPGDRRLGAWRLYTPDGQPLQSNETPVAEALRSGVPKHDVELQLERLDGTRRWVLLSVEPVPEPASGARAIVTFQDITALKQAELQARQGEALFRAIVETTPECVKIVAPDGTLLHMNPAGLRMIEADAPERVLGACTVDLIAPEHRDHWRACHAQVCAGERLSWEFDIVGLQGARRHMETHAVPLRLPDGSSAQLAVTRDITERKRDQAALTTSEPSLRDILNSLPAAVYTTDAAGHITFYNEAAVALSGRRPTLGSDQWCVTWRLYTPEGAPLPHDQCPMAVALKEGRPVRNEEAIAERPDGTRVSFLPYPTPLHDSTGTIIGAVNMLVDISDRKSDEAELRRQREDLEDFFENGVVALHWVASDGTILRANRAELDLLGYRHDEYIGRHIADFHADAGTIGDILGRLRNGERLDKYPARLKAKDGDIRHVLISSNAQFRDGKLIKTRCFTLDVTDLQAAEQRRKLLIDELNHRVKNTLATVQSIAAQTLRSTPTPDAFEPTFTGRLMALSRAHDLLNLESWQGASLQDVLTTAFLAHDPDRVTLIGENLRVRTRAALALSMAVHELASNAAKHGALSAPAGRVEIGWTVGDRNGASDVHLVWKERHGPAVMTPPGRGFGCRLIERGLAHELGGTAQLDFEPDGLRCAITFPL
ncbi:PAS domain-containing sensor histidine kinase [Azospirillum argentinense]